MTHKIIMQWNKILKQNISSKFEFEITKIYLHDPIILNEISKTEI
jgi:hypothetical protein